MTDHAFVTMDVFTDVPFGGNQLAIFPHSAELSTDTMQAIAGEMNISETIFIIDRPGKHPLIRIFTPKAELPFAGHPLVGAAIFLAEHSGRETVTMDVQAGVVTATATAGPTGIEATIRVPQAPVRGSSLEREPAATLLGLPLDELPFEPVTYSAGVPYTFIPVGSRTSLAAIRFNNSIWSAAYKDSWAPAIFALTVEDWRRSDDAYGRMFAPGIGITEDSATGSAAAALAGLLAEKQGRDGPQRWTLYQGEDMGRPSRISVLANVTGGIVEEVSISGTAVPMTKGQLRI